MSLKVDITKNFPDFQLRVRFDNDNQSVGLLGGSGCGKSLTLKCIAGIETPDSGRILLNERTLYDSEKGINLTTQQRRVGLLFQNYALFPNMTVRENIELGIREKKKRKAQVEGLTVLLQITELLERYPGQLSGGEQQRVALARMLGSEPELLLFDEPFSALDSFLKDQLQQELLELLQRLTKDIIMVSHSRDELYRFCKKIAVISQGQLLEFGSKEEIFARPAHRSTMRLTGCKNSSRARKVSEDTVEALDWGLQLKTDRPIEKEICFVGIRAHNLKPGTGMEENSLPVALSGIAEGPFENRIMLQGISPSLEKVHLQWIVSRKDWVELYREQAPKFIILPREHLLLVSDR